MGDISKHVGVGQGTLYRHFPDKEALLTEMSTLAGVMQDRLPHRVLGVAAVA